jgi:type IV pilus assembly protein PilC
MIKKIETSASDLSLLCYQYSVAFSAGIPYLEAVNLLADDVVDSSMKVAATEIARFVEQGEPLADAFSKTGQFPVYMVEMIRVAESTGNLPETFERLSSYYGQMDETNREIKSALTYPVILIGLMTGVILLLVLKILPIFKEVLESVGGTQSSSGDALLSVSVGVQWAILGLILVGVLGAYVVFRGVTGKSNPSRKDRWRLNLPYISNFYKLSSSITFARGMAMMINSGMDHLKALEMIRPMMDNGILENKLKESLNQIREGSSLHESIEHLDIFPSLYLKMLRTGEKSGTLDQTMDHVAEIYEREFSRRLKKISSTVEPALVIVLSIIVGVVMLMVLLPLIEIMSAIG